MAEEPKAPEIIEILDEDDDDPQICLPNRISA